jgi:hypothetical protein
MGCASASGVVVSVARDGDVIKIITTNTSDEPLSLYNPDKLVALPGDPGIEVKVYDHAGHEISSCSMTEPGYVEVNRPTYLGAKQSITRPLSIKLIKMMYCLSPGGLYSIEAVLHPKSNSDIRYISKRFQFRIEQDQNPRN